MDQVNVQNRVAQAQPNLPADVEPVRRHGRASPQALPLLAISLSIRRIGRYDSLFLANYANININDALLRVPGVGQVSFSAPADYAMRIWLKPDVLAKLGLTVADLANAVQQQNTVNPAGQIGGEPAPPGQEMTYTVRAQGRLVNAESSAKIVVRANPDGSVVRLKDVARIELGALRLQRVRALQRKTRVHHRRLSGSRLERAGGCRRRKKTMEELKQRFPRTSTYQRSLDTTLRSPRASAKS